MDGTRLFSVVEVKRMIVEGSTVEFESYANRAPDAVKKILQKWKGNAVSADGVIHDSAGEEK